ncbi:hypothetical protein MTY414_33260 [Mycolicibacterium mageritense]|nr:hypothetical protein MTY414_33260 [Mycolicibacterium mageritense]
MDDSADAVGAVQPINTTAVAKATAVISLLLVSAVVVLLLASAENTRAIPRTIAYHLPAHRAICQAPIAIPTRHAASTTQYNVEVHSGAE